MSNLQYKTRLMTSPKDKARVYFCCHPDDFDKYFETISNEILEKQDCAIWYTGNPLQKRDDDYFFQLRQMQLFVVPITENFLNTENVALDEEYRFALANHIPVLPLMQEEGLIDIFNNKCGQVQFLDKNSCNDTAICYDTKLERYLDSVLPGGELTKRIRDAFDAYIFLSYRKKDRKYAQELMRLVHQNEFCRDIAIWYDEFLTPGEDFNAVIKQSLENSRVFLMVVTPNLVNEENYVMTHEFPLAQKKNKTILPVEMIPTDHALLSTQYINIPDCTDSKDTAQLSSVLKKAVEELSLSDKPRTPMHNFLIGLAYLDGIDVETDHAKALELIQSAAESGVTEAVEKLTIMYSKGQGVERDINSVLYWQQTLLMLRITEFKRSPSKKTGVQLLDDIVAWIELLEGTAPEMLDDKYYQMLFETAKQCYEKYPCLITAQHYASALFHFGMHAREAEQYLQALDFFTKSYDCIIKTLNKNKISVNNGKIAIPAEQKSPYILILLSDMCSSLCNMADMQMYLDIDQYKTNYELVYKYLQSDVLKNKYPRYRSQLSVIYSRMGSMFQAQNNIVKAKEWFLKAVELDEDRVKHAKRNQDTDALDSFASTCYEMGTADPDAPDVEYLQKALDIWKWIAEKLPDFPIYHERVAVLEDYISKINYHKKYIQSEKLPKNFETRIKALQRVIRGFISASDHTLLLKTDGTVVAIGNNISNQCETKYWDDIMYVSASDECSFGVTKKGNVVYATDSKNYGLCPYGKSIDDDDFAFRQKVQKAKETIDSWKNVIEVNGVGVIFANGDNDWVEKQAWGFSKRNYKNVKQIIPKYRDLVLDESGNVHYSSRPALSHFKEEVEKETNVEQIAYTDSLYILLKKNGVVTTIKAPSIFMDDATVAYRNDISQQLSSWKNIIAIDGSYGHVVGLRADGTVKACGNNDYGQCNTQNWFGVIAVAAGNNHTVALRYDGTLLACGDNRYHQCDVQGIRLFKTLADIEKSAQEILHTRELLVKKREAFIKKEEEEKQHALTFYEASSGAQKNKPYSMLQLANCYITGTGTKKDVEKALYWANKSIELDCPNAYGWFGDYYYKRSEYKTALRYAKQGIMKADEQSFLVLQNIYFYSKNPWKKVLYEIWFKKYIRKIKEREKKKWL